MPIFSIVKIHAQPDLHRRVAVLCIEIRGNVEARNVILRLGEQFYVALKSAGADILRETRPAVVHANDQARGFARLDKIGDVAGERHERSPVVADEFAVDPDFRAVGNAVEAKHHAMPRVIRWNRQRRPVSRLAAAATAKTAKAATTAAPEISRQAERFVESVQNSPCGLEIVFQLSRTTATVCVTPAVISGTGTMTGLGQTGFSVTTVADQTVPATNIRLATRTAGKGVVIFSRGKLMMAR